jgi:hypothetical protein
VAALADAASRAVELPVNVPVTGQGSVAVVDGGTAIAGTDGTVGVTMGETTIVDIVGGGLNPALPSSVAPSGMPARAAANAGGAGSDETVGLPAPPDAQACAAPSPPPSNGAAAVCAVEPAAGQPIVLVVAIAPGVGGGIGLVPGAGNSVAPSGMPAGPTGVLMPMLRGDAVSGEEPMPPVVWPSAQPQASKAAGRAMVAKVIFMA